MNDTTLLILLYLFTDPEPKKYTPPLMPATCFFIEHDLMNELDMVCQRRGAEEFGWCIEFLAQPFHHQVCDDYNDIWIEELNEWRIIQRYDAYLRETEEEEEQISPEEGYIK